MAGGSRTTHFHIRLTAMNTHIEAILTPTEAEDRESLLTLIQAWFLHEEERFSRFLPNSELSHLNTFAGELCLVSDEMLEVVALSEQYRRQTDGLFQPLVLKALRSAGYDTTFDTVRNRGAFQAEPPHIPPRDAAGGIPSILIDPLMKSIQLPEGTEMDLGGFVKGWTVGRLAAYLQMSLGVSRGLVNAGGDLSVWGGAPPDGEPWLIGVQWPWEPELDAGMIALREGAAATSGTLGRSWRTASGTAHHLIDPRTMRPSESDIVQCTVSGPDVVSCEVWAKTICIAGEAAGSALFAEQAPGYEALLFLKNGQTVFLGEENSLGRRWLHIQPTRRRGGSI